MEDSRLALSPAPSEHLLVRVAFVVGALPVIVAARARISTDSVLVADVPPLMSVVGQIVAIEHAGAGGMLENVSVCRVGPLERTDEGLVVRAPVSSAVSIAQGPSKEQHFGTVATTFSPSAEAGRAPTPLVTSR